MMPGIESFTRSLDADQFDCLVGYECVEDSHRVRATADARDHRLRKLSRALEHLRSRFATDYRLEVTHHARVRRGPANRSDDVMRIVDVRDPVANCLVERVLERTRAGFDWHHGRAHELHPKNIQLLTMRVF